MTEYGEKLLRDLQYSMSALDIESVSSVFFGGGTPSLMSAQTIADILTLLSPKLVTNAEISLEANPATFDEGTLKDFRSAGINRLSLGIQSFQGEHLKFLGRIYSEKQVRESVDIVAKVFDNFSFDFMYGYQTIDSVVNDLQTAIQYGVKHISCYQLTLEPGTPFFARFSRINKTFESSDEYMPVIEKVLLSHGLHRYEVSNFAQPNYESKHNLTYWNYGEYLGCGPSAHSRVFIDGKKHAMTKASNLKIWSEQIGYWDTDNILSYSEQLEEMIVTGLRRVTGINFVDLLQQIPEKVVQKIITPEKIKFLREHGLISPQSDTIKLTSEGMMKLNSVVEKLLIS